MLLLCIGQLCGSVALFHSSTHMQHMSLRLGFSADPLMVSEASAVPADQLERNTLAIGLLHNRFRILETRLAFLDERFFRIRDFARGAV